MRRALPATAIALAALAAPSSADAHGRTKRIAVDYEARVAPLRPPLAGAVELRTYPTDLAVRLTALHGHRVVVLGYQGEPFLRLGPDGASVNAASLTAAGAGLTKRTDDRGWRPYARRPSVVWHDARVHSLPPGVDRRTWTIPVRVDGAPADLSGELTRVAAPPAWPWLVVAAVFAAAAALLLVRRASGALRTASEVLGWVAAGATVLSSSGFAASATASEDTWLEAGIEIGVVLLLAAFLVHGSRDTRALSGALLGLMALTVGLTSIPVLLHGVVLSALPGTVARASVVVAISAGAAAVVCGLLVFVDVLAHYEEPTATERYL